MAKFRLRDGTGEISLKYTIRDTDRHGNVRVYFRRPGGPKIRLLEKPGTDAFLLEYRSAATGGKPKPKGVTSKEPIADTLSWLFLRYLESAEFKGLHASTRQVRRLLLEHIAAADGNKPFRLLETKHVRRMRDLKAAQPEAANARVRALRAVFGWATLPGVELATTNPAKDVPYIERKGEGFHSWTDREIDQFVARHPIGTSARLAMSLLLYTGQRRSDVVLFGPRHVHDGWLHFTQQKNKDRKPIYLEIPIQPELQAVLDASKLGAQTFLVNKFGKSFSPEGFSNWFRMHCVEAGLQGCTAHGLRKAAARRMAEDDRSGHQIMAITGHTTLKEVDRYTRAANQRKLAGQAFPSRQAPTQKVPQISENSEGETKAAVKPLK